MRRPARCAVTAMLLLCLVRLAAMPLAQAQQAGNSARAWLSRARIGAYGLGPSNAEEIVRLASDTDVAGIEVDNDITGRYESFLDPTAKLRAIHAVAEAAHRRGNHAFVYISGFECITANADTAARSMARDHPEWLQRKISGEPAIFHAGTAFWIKKGDEDAWVTPYAPEWRRIYMERVRQIAATGIDGIYVDIPYWKTDFPGWENSWASFDNYTVAAFRRKTGLDARKDIRLGDFSDPGFRKWVLFRIASITDFLAEIRRNAVSVNPNIAVIPEIYPGIEPDAVRVGADVYGLYPVVDAVSHEYEFGDSDDHTAASRGELDWFLYQVGIQTFRAFAQGKPTWILNYSWDGNPRVRPSDAMQNLAMSEVMAGANFWDAPGHVMAGSNDPAMRRRIFQWIEANQDHLFAPRTPLGQVGVYFSEATRNFYPEEFVTSWRGVLLLLLQRHIQFQIVTPRTLSAFHGKVLVLPDLRMVDEVEMRELRRFCAEGGKVVTTGAANRRLDGLPGVTAFPDDPGSRYLADARKNPVPARAKVPEAFLRAISLKTQYDLTASPHLVVYIDQVGGRTLWFLANFRGLLAGDAEAPIAARNVILHAPLSAGTTLHLVPFLGTPVLVRGTVSRREVRFDIPRVDRGAVAWTEAQTSAR